MSRKKLPYRPGDLFAVPLRCGGFAVGVVARADGRGTVLGYFFGPRRDDLPMPNDVGELRGEDLIEIAIFGDLGLIERRWPAIGPLPGWKSENWPVPSFGRIDAVSGNRAWRVRYQDPDLTWLSEEEIDVSEAAALPKDRLMGAGAVERWLSHLLDRDQSPGRSARSSAPARA